MTVQDMTGILPAWTLLYQLSQLRAAADERLNVGELCKIVRCHESSIKALCYVGYARKGRQMPAGA